MQINSRQRSNRYNAVLIGMMAAVYLLFSVGVVKATHFCMGKEASVSFFTVEAEACACSLSESAQVPCCSDEQGLLKLENSQKTLSFFQIGMPVLGLLGEIYTRSLDPGKEIRAARFDALLPPRLRTTLYHI